MYNPYNQENEIFETKNRLVQFKIKLEKTN